MQNNRILIADDEPDIGDVISAVAEDLDFDVTFVQEGNKVVSRAEALDPSVIVLDLRMPGADGVEILSQLAGLGSTASIVLISGMDQRTLNTVESLGREKNLDMVGTLTKPMHPDQIEAILAPLRGSKAEPAPAQVTANTTVSSLFGPGVSFVPQVFQGGSNNQIQRATLEVGWWFDNGDELHGDELFNWASEQQLSKGLLSLLLKEALQQWKNMGVNAQSLQFVLPLPPVLFEDLSMITTISDMASQFEFPGKNLVVETGETGIYRSGNNAIESLSRLRIAGFQTAFITESDTDELLSMIDKLPMDEIVVDMSFLKGRQGIESNMELEFSYSSLTSLARKKQIDTSAKGVTSSDIADFVKRCQFDWAEGAQLVHKKPISELGSYYSGG